ncbi:hypothetical protein PIROE2DRAFT_1325 [Piromyces sp. E2]|nr:hypothetical protein PIROE2DRAFT_1325 [Piromyces sp. E2]|eukprot:OUM70462.1 hypothetical protein PIROE2DRAFT_1325 [Piromyces sp. E2]
MTCTIMNPISIQHVFYPGVSCRHRDAHFIKAFSLSRLFYPPKILCCDLV